MAFKTAEFAKKNEIDVALIDTAGRLQNKKNLMEEYKKIIGVLKKIDPSYPNEVILVLDATTGQNALNQVIEFKEISNLTGIIITKLDTEAKGGILLSISKEFSLPIIAIGLGEKEKDLHPFSAKEFSKILEEIKKGFLLNLKMTKEQYEKEVINTGAKDLLTFYDRISKKYGTNWKPLSYVGKT